MILNLAVTIIGVFAAALLRGFTGFGFGLAAVPMLSMALPPAEVVPLVVTLQLAIGVIGVCPAMKLCEWAVVWMLLPGLILGVPIGLLILTTLPPNPVRIVIGVIIGAAVWLIRSGFRLPPNPSRLLAFGIGTLSGTINGLASMGGAPVVIYLMALGHTTQRMRATAIVYFMLAACVSFVPMAARGMITQAVLVWTAASLPALIGGSRLGAWAFGKAQPRHHRIVALVALSVLALSLVTRAALN